MFDPYSSAALASRLDELRARYPAAQVDVVAEIAREVVASTLSAVEERLLAEVAELGRTISNAKAEIAALQVDEITASQIPSATDELDAIVAHTASATNSILEVCETLDQLADGLAKDAAPAAAPEAASSLQEATTRIYEACSFQDITGQRITKVVTTLKTIESKVAGIVSTFGAEDANPARREPRQAELVSGPQLPAAAMDQTDIDKLLASFE
jgi:chemotaxis protein CheZ